MRSTSDSPDHEDMTGTAERPAPVADRHIAEAEKRIACQRDVIECLAAHGHNTAAAEELLLFTTQILARLKKKDRKREARPQGRAPHLASKLT